MAETGGKTWGEGNLMNATEETDWIFADHVELCNLPEETTKKQLHDFIVKKDIHIDIGQLMRDPENKSKWRVMCVMMMIHKCKIGSGGRRIECFPAMTSTPPNNQRHQPWFAPSRDNSGTGFTVDEGVVRDLAADMMVLEEGDKVGPNTNVHCASNARANGLTNPLSNQPQDDSGESGNSVKEIKLDGEDDDDNDIKVVDEDDHTLPKPGSGPEIPNVTVQKKASGGYEVQGSKPVRKRTESLGKKKPAVKPVPLDGETPKEAKARLTMKNLMEVAKSEAESTQAEAEAKASIANKSRDEADLKIAEKAEKAAATAKRKFLLLEGKWEALSRNAENLRKMSESGKRGPEDQSPGKTDEEEWVKVDKQVRNSKKKTKEKSAEALEIEKSLFNQH